MQTLAVDEGAEVTLNGPACLQAKGEAVTVVDLEALSHDAFARLRQPITLGGVPLKNRVVHASITTFYVQDQRVTDRFVDYHRARAQGGCAAIIIEPTAVLSWQIDEPHKVRLFDDSQVEHLARLVDAVEAHDCRLLGQIQDSGRGRHRRGRKRYCYAPSALPDDLSGTMPRALTIEQIQRAVEEVGKAAARMQRCSFSGLEISAGHGHLVHQFLSPWSNHRQDAYGGDLDGRMRFLLDMLDAIRAETRKPFILAVKAPGDDGVPGGIGPDGAAAIAARLAATGEVDAFAFCQGSHHRSLEHHMPDMYGPRAPYDALTARLRGCVNGAPTAALGRLVDPVQAETVLRRGDADFVQIGRALITDANWVNKALDGREHELRACVSCNTCWGQVVSGAPMACDNNPRLGTPDEATWTPPATLARRRVVVVGAGPAGLEAAWVAAGQGHDVTVLGRGASYGGKLALLAAAPGCDQVSSVYDYQVARGAREGVRYDYGVEANLESIVALAPDAVVLATGAEMEWPAGWPQSWREDGAASDLREVCALFTRATPIRRPGVAVIQDNDHTAATYAVAVMLASHFEHVVLATAAAILAREEPIVVQQSVQRRLATAGVEIVHLNEVAPDSELEDGEISLRNVYSGERRTLQGVALLTYAGTRRPVDDLYAPLCAAGLDVRLIGDAYAPRDLLTATAEGHAAGLAI
jgi:2,4-dienoyl-CoA reductase-like NADH-dependent reductase (Old Yellow Enzyme family)